ncbi:MAG: hypothetical protein ACRDMJ_19600 [Solirubrobacteraceae bacterium]
MNGATSAIVSAGPEALDELAAAAPELADEAGAADDACELALLDELEPQPAATSAEAIAASATIRARREPPKDLLDDISLSSSCTVVL